MKALPRALASLVACTVLLLGCEAGRQSADPPLRVGLLRIVDAAPFFAARDTGLFTDAGLTVDLQQVASAAERDQLLASGAFDVVLNDLVSAVIYAATTRPAVVVSLDRTSTTASQQFSILASAALGLTRISEMRGRTIAVSDGTVIDYVTTRLLGSAGLAAGDYQTVSVPAIAERMELLQSGGVDAATLPDPFTTMALDHDAVLIDDDRSLPGIGASVISVTPAALANRRGDIVAMLRVLETAAGRLTDSPSSLVETLHAAGLLASGVDELTSVPVFAIGSHPDMALVEDVAAWALHKGLIDAAPGYEDVVQESVLGGPATPS